MSVYDTIQEDKRDEALETAVTAVRDGRLIVLPTDTVYGIGADAFSPHAVQDLLDAKGRGRTSPPPVLIGDHAVLMALAVDLPEYVEDLADAFWPGPLTIVLQAQPSLTWDLGETRGTVALRMPDDEVALALLKRTGPLAVSSANRHGKPAATTVLSAATQLGDSVEVYLDGGESRGGVSSTILDATVEPAVILREGAISREEIIEAVGDIFTAPAGAADGTSEDHTESAEPDAAGPAAVDPEGAADDAPDRLSAAQGQPAEHPVAATASPAVDAQPETGARSPLNLPSEVGEEAESASEASAPSTESRETKDAADG